MFIAALSFLLVLSFLVFFHELGHYSVARLFGMSVDRFSIGFGKPIWRRTSKAGVEWVISRIPLGGYVKFTGDAGAASNPDAEKLEKIRIEYAKTPDGPSVGDIFHFRPVWQRALVVLAGPIANFILAIIIFAGIGMTYGERSFVWVVGEVTEGSPADKAGVQTGERLIEMDGQKMRSATDIITYISLRSGTPIMMSFVTDGVTRAVIVTPERKTVRDGIGAQVNVGRIGMGTGEGSSRAFTKLGPVTSVKYGVRELSGNLKSTFYYIKRIFSGKESGKQLGSVVKIATVTGKIAADTASIDAPAIDVLKAYAYNMLHIMASISIALGFANLMPLPVLDGGHLMYYGYEAVAGRPLSQKKQEFGFKIGFAILLTLFVVLTINDIGYVGSIIS